MELSTHRWRKHLTYLAKKSHARHCTSFANWAKDRWNEQPDIAESGQTVVEVELFVYFKPNLPSKRTTLPTRTTRLYCTPQAEVNQVAHRDLMPDGISSTR